MVNTSWLKISKPGLYVLPAKAHIDPIKAVNTAIITHGHSDHARPGHKHVIATKQTLAIMSARYGENFANQKTALACNFDDSCNTVMILLIFISISFSDFVGHIRATVSAKSPTKS